MTKHHSKLTKQSNKAASLNLYIKGEKFKMAGKLGKQIQVTVEGIEYTLQHPGSEEYLKMQDRMTGEKGMPSYYKTAEEVFKNVVVSPEVNFAFFDEHDGMDVVVEKALTFLRSGKAS